MPRRPKPRSRRRIVVELCAGILLSISAAVAPELLLSAKSRLFTGLILMVISADVIRSRLAECDPSDPPETFMERSPGGFPGNPPNYVADIADSARRLEDLLAGRRVIAVLGEAGIGKSTCAARAVNAAPSWNLYGDRRCWVDLAAGGSLPPVVEVESWLDGRPFLLVIDGFERMLLTDRKAAEGLVRSLETLPSKGATIVIVCQGRPDLLSQPFDTVFPEPLSPGGAAALFELVSGLQPSGGIERLLGRVGRLPLAIVLLAESVKEVGLDALLALERVSPALMAHEASDCRTNIGYAVDLTLTLPGVDEALRNVLAALRPFPAGLDRRMIAEVLPDVDTATMALRRTERLGLARPAEAGLALVPAVALHLAETERDPNPDLDLIRTRFVRAGLVRLNEPAGSRWLHRNRANVAAACAGRWPGVEELAVRIAVESIEPPDPCVVELLTSSRLTLAQRQRLLDCEPPPAEWERYSACAEIKAALFRAAKRHAEEARVLRRFAAEARLRSHYDAAEVSERRAVGLSRRLQDPAGEAESLWGLAEACRLQGRYDDALPLYSRAIAVSNKIDLPSIRGRSHWGRGSIHEARSNFPAARKELAKAKEIFLRSSDRRGVADCDVAMGDVLTAEGEPVQAQSAYGAALATYAEIEDQIGQGNALLGIGRYIAATDERSRAEAKFSRALGHYRTIGHRKGEAAVLEELGDLAGVHGSHQDAYDYHQQALRLYQQIGSRRGVASALGGIAAASHALHRFDEAAALFRRVKGLREATGSRRGVAVALIGLGRAECNRGYLDAAAEQFRRAEEIGEMIGLPSAVMLSNLGLGDVAVLGYAYEAAEKYYRKALITARALNDRQAEALALQGLATVSATVGRSGAAHSLVVEADEIFATMGIGRPSFPELTVDLRPIQLTRSSELPPEEVDEPVESS